MIVPIITATASAVTSTSTSTIGTGVAATGALFVGPIILGAVGIVMVSFCFCITIRHLLDPGATFVSPEESELINLESIEQVTTAVTIPSGG